MKREEPSNLREYRPVRPFSEMWTNFGLGHQVIYHFAKVFRVTRIRVFQQNRPRVRIVIAWLDFVAKA